MLLIGLVLGFALGALVSPVVAMAVIMGRALVGPDDEGADEDGW